MKTYAICTKKNPPGSPEIWHIVNLEEKNLTALKKTHYIKEVKPVLKLKE